MRFMNVGMTQYGRHAEGWLLVCPDGETDVLPVGQPLAEALEEVFRLRVAIEMAVDVYDEAAGALRAALGVDR